MNVRQIANFSPNYFEINREERNYAAIFFAALCIPGKWAIVKYNNNFSDNMEELLGIKTEFMFLVYKKEASATHKVINWKEAFESVDIRTMPKFVRKMVSNIST